jgi:hypothetical protein
LPHHPRILRARQTRICLRIARIGQRAAHVLAADLWHDEIDDGDVGRRLGRAVERFPPSGRAPDAVSLVLEYFGDQRDRVRVVIDDEDVPPGRVRAKRNRRFASPERGRGSAPRRSASLRSDLHSKRTFPPPA